MQLSIFLCSTKCQKFTKWSEIKPSTPMKLKNDYQCNQCKLKSKTKKDMRVHILTCHSKSNRIGHSPNVKRLGRALARRKVGRRPSRMLINL